MCYLFITQELLYIRSFNMSAMHACVLHPSVMKHSLGIECSDNWPGLVYMYISSKSEVWQ